MSFKDSSADLMKSEEGDDTLRAFTKIALEQESSSSFLKAEDSSKRLLEVLEDEDVERWPSLLALELQMQECEKCGREFFSSINYRRHSRLHHRNLNLNKDLPTNTRDLLSAFWDKLSTDKAMDVLSFNGVSLKKVTSSSIISALTSITQEPGSNSFPDSYIEAGSVLLDIVRSRPFMFPISSEKLFNILDYASEGTFLCAGTAEELEKYMFDGKTGEIVLETNNLVACVSFLVELKLAKAWLAEKDAEASRCQKLLVEEEESAQRRQAALLQKKAQKKLRQKEQKAKKHINQEMRDSEKDEATMDNPLDPSTSSLHEPMDTISEIPRVTCHQLPLSPEHEEEHTKQDMGDSQEDASTTERPSDLLISSSRVVSDTNSEIARVNCHQLPSSSEHDQDHTNRQTGDSQEHAFTADPPSDALTSSACVASYANSEFTRMPCDQLPSSPNRDQVLIVEEDANVEHRPDSFHNTLKHQPIKLGVKQKNRSFRHTNKVRIPKLKPDTDDDHHKTSLRVKEGAVLDQNKRGDVVGSVSVSTASSSKQMQEVNHVNEGDDSKGDDIAYNESDQILRTSSEDGVFSGHEDSLRNVGDASDRLGRLRSSIRAAKAFLSQRWKEAVASERSVIYKS